MTRRAKTPEEMHEQLKMFDAACKQETAQWMRNAVERMMAAGQGRRMPAKYKLKLPMITTTVAEKMVKTLRAANSRRTKRPLRISPRLSNHARLEAAKVRRIKAGKRERQEAAEVLELRRSMANAVERAIAFGAGRKLPRRYVWKNLRGEKDRDPVLRSMIRPFQAAGDRLLEGVRLDNPPVGHWQRIGDSNEKGPTHNAKAHGDDPSAESGKHVRPRVYGTERVVPFF
jgi:hypothetical protein